MSNCVPSCVPSCAFVFQSPTAQDTVALTTGLTLRLRKFEPLPNVGEHIALGDAAGITFVYCCAQCHQFRLVLLLVPLQGSQRGAHNLAGILIAAAPAPRPGREAWPTYGRVVGRVCA